MSDMCKAAVFTGVGKIEIIDIKKPVPKSNEVLVKLKACAICTWEQRVYQGINKVDFPFIGGHEESGVITAIGEDIDPKLWKVGDRVVVGLMTSCGVCHNCRIGEEGCCTNFNYENRIGGLDIKGMGGFSEYLAVPLSKIFKIESDLSDEEAALVEPLSCVVHSVNMVDIKFSDSVVVVGAGIMGVFHAMLARLKGARVIIVEPNDQRLDFMRKLGFNECINPSKQNAIEAVKSLTNQEGANIVFNTVGVSKLAEESVEMSALYGKVILYSSYHPDTPISLSPNRLHRRMTEVIGSANSNTTDFITALNILDHKIIDVKQLISKVVPFKDIEYGIKEGISPLTYRVVVKFD
ncbi:alcohol dehydrogenase [Gilliamella sp. wkB108]|uniref:zinc-dependent alcohol dehydrogenase n=1 Tax=Gilliamella sp. wkB108 TaxID=3120256 RepID=UPI00080E9A16|nr:alcohol dehydrogenase catalytic domain-containing protein [Gilliamella apicola]OCG23911.1 alcohol dehydrogenase [Gilliamella apicola]